MMLYHKNKGIEERDKILNGREKIIKEGDLLGLMEETFLFLLDHLSLL